MESAPPRLWAALLRLLPGPVRRKLQGETGRRFTRFVLVAMAAVVASQVALVCFLDGAHMTAGISGGLAAVVGAAVSYVLSRWAWERKGKPHVLKETLPFWIVAVAAWVVLGLATKLGVHWAGSVHRGSLKWHLVVNGTYFGANVLTFLARFVIFHYVLFADRGSSTGSAGAGTTTSGPSPEGTVPEVPAATVSEGTADAVAAPGSSAAG
jgi:putative flippase GtrA